ncbi:hypothetical protein DSO57_1006739 [Entomophthora muscae]|nr:hypothetical protein DSO57_1006739 [Entomophthora muscae]
MMCLGIFPLIWGGIADRFGRRWIFIISLLIFIGSNIGAALAQSIEMLIIMRIFQGVGSSAPLVVGVGVVSDIFPEKERGVSISIFFSGTLVGPIIGPIIGGFLDTAFGWRSTFWFLTIFTSVIELLTLVFLPETLSTRKPFPYQISLCPPSIKKVGSFFNPFSALILMKYPIVLLGSLVPALTFGTFFAIESFHSRAMGEQYHLDSSSVGLSFLVLGAGSILGNFCGGKLSDVMNNREKKKSMPTPEARLHGLWACASLLVGGLLAYGWFIEYKFPIWAPILATFFIGFGYTSGSIGASAYLVDLAPNYASSITACATFVRMTISTITTGFNTPIIEGLGYGRGITIHASLSFIVVLILVLLVFKGSSIRQKTGP